DKYVGAVKQPKKNDNMQDAHEGIRVTSPYRTPESLKQYLSADEYKLYSLIYARSLACLMADAKVKATAITLLNNDYEFKATGSILIFDGYLKVYGKYESSEDVILPDLTGITVLNAEDVIKEQHFTKPAPRYTESSLIKELERLGIGRPSTYATIMETIKARDYVTVEDKKFVPTKVGIETTNKLQEGFSDIINVEYTANMETELDEIAEAKINNVELLKEFYNKFEPLVEDAFKTMEKKEAEQTGENCPECGSPLVIRNGRYGEFVACSNYPECKFIKKEEVPVLEICDCPNCEGKIIERKSRKGKVFYGCNNYPKCKTAYWYKPVDRKCPECGEMLLEKSKKIVCSSCEYEDE
ncbi:MAG: topoisomerase DNA-binding C4 zinc finger domain-containing protein, partial [Bacilli bacterium]|nr:topoisomerase DNA-binding C4 zinc finger domain-containing protein [Bacilli bacterium]